MFDGYLIITSNFSHLYRNTTMSEFEFFEERADRWGNSMKALWGSLEICPPTDNISLPRYTAGELHSIGHLRVWGDVHKPHLGMVYLLVWVDDTSEVGNYGLDIVWVDSCQAGIVSMGEALESLSSLTPKGSDWPYTLIQLYEGTNCMPSPKIDTFVSYPKERWEALVGR